jgi:hypothetical protein
MSDDIQEHVTRAENLLSHAHEAAHKPERSGAALVLALNAHTHGQLAIARALESVAEAIRESARD